MQMRCQCFIQRSWRIRNWAICTDESEKSGPHLHKRPYSMLMFSEDMVDISIKCSLIG